MGARRRGLHDRRGRGRPADELAEPEKPRAENRPLKAQARQQQMEIDFLKNPVPPGEAALKRTRHLDTYIAIKGLAEGHPEYPVSPCRPGHVARPAHYKWKDRPGNENDTLSRRMAGRMAGIHGGHPDMGHRRIRGTLGHDYGISPTAGAPSAYAAKRRSAPW